MVVYDVSSIVSKKRKTVMENYCPLVMIMAMAMIMGMIQGCTLYTCTGPAVDIFGFIFTLDHKLSEN